MIEGDGRPVSLFPDDSRLEYFPTAGRDAAGPVRAAGVRADRRSRHDHRQAHRTVSSHSRHRLGHGSQEPVPPVHDSVIQPNSFGETNLIEIRHDDYPSERLIASRNPVLGRKRAHERQRLSAATPLSEKGFSSSPGTDAWGGRDRIGLNVAEKRRHGREADGERRCAATWMRPTVLPGPLLVIADFERSTRLVPPPRRTTSWERSSDRAPRTRGTPLTTRAESRRRTGR